MASSQLKEVYNPKAVFPHAALLRHAFAHCARFPTAASRRSLGRVSVPVWLIVLSDQLPIEALVGHYPTNKLMGRGPIPLRKPKPPFLTPTDVDASTFGISPGFPGLSQSTGQVTHVLLTRSRLCPRASPGSSLHLHVLSTPPAFVLSQDQTLREVNYCRHTRRRAGYEELSDLIVARAIHVSCRGMTGFFLRPSRSRPKPETRGVEPGRTPSTRLGRKVRMLLSFQRPSRPVGKGFSFERTLRRAEALGAGPSSLAPLDGGCGLPVRPDVPAPLSGSIRTVRTARRPVVARTAAKGRPCRIPCAARLTAPASPAQPPTGPVAAHRAARPRAGRDRPSTGLVRTSRDAAQRSRARRG